MQLNTQLVRNGHERCPLHGGAEPRGEGLRVLHPAGSGRRLLLRRHRGRDLPGLVRVRPHRRLPQPHHQRASLAGEHTRDIRLG